MLFRKHSFNVKMVKDEEPDLKSAPIDLDNVATILTRKISTIIVTYVAVDTLRRVAVYVASAKI